MDKNHHKIQHIVPQCIIKQWKIESVDKTKPSTLKILDKEEIKIIKYRDNKNYFAKTYEFEIDQNSPNGRIEKKLSKLEQNYAQYVKTLIDNEKSIKENKKFPISWRNRATIFTFTWTQRVKTNLPLAYHKTGLLKKKELENIEKQLDAYFKIQKMTNEKVEKEYQLIEKEIVENNLKYKFNHKKRTSDYWRILSDPLKKLIFYSLNPDYFFGLRYFAKPIWPLPIQGTFIWNFSDEESEIAIRILPITPRIVLIDTWTILQTEKQVERLKEKTFDTFCDENLQDSISWMLLHHSANTKMPIILPELCKINLIKIKQQLQWIEKLQKEMRDINQKNKHRRKKYC